MLHLRAALLASSAIVAVAHANPALAQSRTFDVPAQSAASGITAFAEQADIQILVVEADTRGRQTRAVRGAMTAEAGLRELLTGSGLSIIADNGRTVTLSAAPQSASAGGDVDALIVTAQKREENIQDVPIAISAFSQEDLTRSQVAGGPDLMTQVPNMTFTKTNFSGYSIQIRGIGTQAISATTDPAVAVAFNNTPFIRNRFFEQEFYDLQRVEVLRGPQGTLYGRNATAGVVNIISAKPSFEYEAKLAGDVASYNSTRLEGMINLPLDMDDRMSLRLAGAWTKREGFVENRLTGEQTDGRDLWSTRATLRFQPTDALDINLIWEHFEENDDRLRTGKQLCRPDPGPMEINGRPVEQIGGAINFSAAYFSQGCLPTSLYSPDAFQTPNGYALPYYGPLQQLGSPVYLDLNPYASELQSRDLREIETHLKPIYEASSDLVELQVSVDLPGNLSLTSETAFSRDTIFSFQDLNRFDTTPGVFEPGGRYNQGRYDVVPLSGVFCDPQLGCTDRLAAGDLSTAKSKQFSQEFRLGSNYDGPFNFNLGANFLRYDTEDKYYVFVNTLTGFTAMQAPQWTPGVTDNYDCLPKDFFGNTIGDPNQYYFVEGCMYIDPNDVRNLNDQGRNYFLSRNPYHLLSYAGFGEAYYQITPNLKLTGGLRWTVDRKEAPQLPSWLLAGDTYGNATRKVVALEWSEPTGRLALDWKPDLSFTDDTLVYGSYVRGYKAGGANPPPAMVVLLGQGCPPTCQGDDIDLPEGVLKKSLTHPETFDAEYVDAFEIGAKNTFLDGRLTANFSAFYYDYRGYQISQIVNRSAVNLNFDAKVWGAELEVDWRPIENLRLGFKGGYENTRMADGSQAIDLMDRTAGKEGWILVRPFPTLTANCVFPEEYATMVTFTFICQSYLVGLDPVTYLPYVENPQVWSQYGNGIEALPPELQGYPGFDPRSANNGEGFTKDLSGNELPNAPDFTATVTIDYTVPLPNDWLMTLHSDLYYQSEAWTRIFNTEGYDKLKAYTNVNLAAIFTNEEQGWNIMAYVKNVFDRDSITGSFLFSDDVGLTTNVFLNEPRIYGVRVSKEWTGMPWSIGSDTHEGPYPFTVEVGGQVQQHDAPLSRGMPFADVFSGALDVLGSQDGREYSEVDGREVRLTYQPVGSPWKVSAGLRYGRTGWEKGADQRREEIAGPTVCNTERTGDFGFVGNLRCDPTYGPVTRDLGGGLIWTFENKYDPSYLLTPVNRSGSSYRRQEEHTIVDFTVGRELGLGAFGEGKSALVAGLRFAEFEANSQGEVVGIPDMTVPEGWSSLDSAFSHHRAAFRVDRSFEGVGPTVTWEGSRNVLGDDRTGRVNVDWSATGGALFGKQKTTVGGTQGVDNFSGPYPTYPAGWADLPAVPQQPIDVAPRVKSVTAPLLDLSLGLSYEAQRFKVGAGYRWERYFDVLDGGYDEHQSYSRTIHGPYFKIAVGFGG